MAINLASRLSSIATDFAGVNHIVWLEDNAIWHAEFNANAGTWINARRVVEGLTQSVTALSLVANEQLIGNSNSGSPGLAVIWQAGNQKSNSSNFYYAAAQYGPNGQLQWDASPTALTVNQTSPGAGGLPFANLAPRVIADNSGSITVVGQQVNVKNAADQTIREDTDLYATSFSITSVTPATTVTPDAFYEPPVITDGVNQASGIPVNQSTATTQARGVANTNSKSSFGQNSLFTASATSGQGYQGIGFKYGPSLSFSTGLYKALGLDQYISGIPGGLLKLVMEPYDLVGIIAGSGLGGSELSVISQGIVERGTGKQDEKEDPYHVFEKTKKGVSISLAYSSRTSYDKTPPYYLASIEDILSLSLLDKIPIFNKPAGLWAGKLDFIGSVGLAAVLELQSSGDTTDTLLQLILDDAGLNLPSDVLGFISSAQLSDGKNGIAGALIAATVFGPIEDILIGNLTNSTDLTISKYLVGPTIGANVEGLLLLAEAIKFTAAAGVDLFFGIGQGGDETTVLRIPLELGVGLGPIGLNLSIEPTWVWPNNPPLTTSGNTTTTAGTGTGTTGEQTSQSTLSSSLSTSSDTPAASVTGSLLTLTFNAPLDVNSVPSTSDFGLSTQAWNQSSTVPYAGSIGSIAVGNDPGTGNGVVVLQLSQPLAYSPQFSGPNPQPAPGPNGQTSIFLSYSGTTLQYSNDAVVGKFTDITVVNNSPQSLTAVFNPTTGNGQNYSVGNQQALLGSLEADYAQDSPAALALVITPSHPEGQVLAVWSREVQPLTPIAGFVDGDEIYLNFVQAINSGATLDNGQFTVFVNGDSGITTVTNAEIETGGYIKLNLSQAVKSTDTVKISYSLSSSSQANNLYLTDAVKSQLWIPAFSELLNNITGQTDTTAPTLEGGTVIINNTGNGTADNLVTMIFKGLLGSNTPNGSQFIVVGNGQAYLSLNFSAPLNTAAIPDASAFSVSNGGNSSITIQDIFISQSNPQQLVLSLLTGAANITSSLEINYAVPTTGTVLTYASGSSVGAFTASYDSDISTPGAPTIGSGVSNVAVSGNTVTFKLAAATTSNDAALPLISQGDIVTVTYIPGSQSNQNLIGQKGEALPSVSASLTTLPETPTTTLMAGFNTSQSTFQNIPGTTGFNADPAVAADTNGNALAVWVYADSSSLVNLSAPGEFYTDDQTQLIINVLNQSDIYFSYWNGSQWTIAAPLATDQPGTDRNVTVAYDSASNQYIAAWLNSNDTFQVFDPKIESSASPSLININNTFYLAYVEQGGTQISLTSSNDAGQNWATAVQLPITVATTQSPALAFYQDELYLAYVGTNNELNITSSSDNGKTWSTPYIVSGRFSNNGVSLVVYQGQLMAFTVSDFNSEITYCFSNDPQLSTSWSQPYTFPTPEGYPTTASSGVSATVMGNTLFLAYRGGTVDSAASYYTASTSGSTLSSLTWNVSQLNSATSPNTAPGITSDGSQLYFTYGNSNGELYYLTSGNGTSWSGLNAITNQSTNDLPSPATLNGELYIAYTSNDNEESVYVTQAINETTIYWASYSPTDSTTPWSKPTKVLSEATPDPLTDLVISSVNGQPALFWTQTQPISYSQLTTQNDPSLYFRLGELAGTTAQNQGTLGAMANGTYNSTFTLKEAGALFDSSNKSGDPNPAALFSNGGSMTIGGALLTNGSSFSVEFWFKIPAAISETNNLVNLNGVFGVALNNNNGDTTLTFTLQNTSSSSITTSASANPFDINTWYYVVGTYSDQTQELSLYINGQQIATLNQILFTAPASATFSIAGGNDAVYLDEVALYNNVLSYGTPPTSNTTSSLDLLNTIFNTDQIGEKYASQYFAPLAPGPQAQISLLDTNSNIWSTQSQINPLPFFQPTTLSDANSPLVDVVTNTASSSTGDVYPNGQEDTVFSTTINGFQGKVIESISLTLSNNITYTVGNSSSGNQLGVVVGDTLINNANPNTPFNYAVMGLGLTLNLLVDTGAQPSANIKATSFSISFEDGTVASNTSAVNRINLPQFVPPDSVPVTPSSEVILGTATVTEAEDSSLTLIDSGLAINTTNSAMGYVIVSADFNNDGKSDVAVGNRGYTDSSGSPLNGGTIQILMGGQAPLSGNTSVALSPPTSNDPSAATSGNAQGFAIVGIPDKGIANGNVSLSMTTGDVNADGYVDLIIGSPNMNSVYVVLGSYLISQNYGAVINVGDLANNQNIGFQITTPPGVSSCDQFGFAVTAGNFDQNGGLDIAIGAPGAKSGNGAVYVVYNPGTEKQVDELFYSGQAQEQVGFALATSAYVANSSLTFSGNQSSDDLIVGAPNYSQLVSNNWSGINGIPSNTPNPFPKSTAVSVGAVYVFTSSSGGLNPTASYTYIGTDANTPSNNGAAQNLYAGSALASGDWNGDKQLDLAIAAPGGNESSGTVFILSGSQATSSANSQYLNQVNNLTLNGGLPLGLTGAVVASAGDVNDDDYEDLLVTAPQGANAVGQGYVVFGDSDLLGGAGNTVLNLSPVASDTKSTFLLNGKFPYQLTGQAAAAIGDINNDGVDDLMMSAPNANQLYAVYGHPWLADDGSIKLANISGDNGFVTDGNQYIIPLGPQVFDIPNTSSLSPSFINYNETFYLAFVGEFDAEYQRGGAVYLTTSNDAGRSWSNTIQLPSTVTTNAPVSMAFYQGVLYLAYTGDNVSSELNICYSMDNGQTWSNPYTIWAYSGSSISLVEYQGQLMLFFTGASSSNPINYIYSQNPQSSTSWSNNKYTVPNRPTVYPISATVMNNVLYLAYIGAGAAGGAESCYVTSATGSDLAALQWNSSSTMIDGTNNFGDAPALTNDGSQLYLSYVDNSGTLSYATSNNGTNWSSLTEISNQSSNLVETAVPAVLDSVLYLSYINTTVVDASGSIFVTAVNANEPLFGTGNNVVMLGDINGDGFADLISGGSVLGAVISFGASTQDLLDAAAGTDELIITIAGPGSIASVLPAGDFNGDGLADFGVVDLNNNFYLVLGNIDLGYLPQQSMVLDVTTSPTSTVGNTTSAVAVGDYNGDGYDDLLLTVGAQQLLYTGNSAGSFSNSIVFTANNNTVFNGIGDVNGDGFVDIGGGAPSSNQVSQFSLMPNGAGTVYLGNPAASSANGLSLNPPEAGISSASSPPLNNSAWLNTTYPYQQTKFNSSPSFAALDSYLYMAYAGVNNSSANGSLYVQSSGDGLNWGSAINFNADPLQTSTGYSLAVLNNTLYAAYLNTSAELVIAYSSPSDNDLGLAFSNTQVLSTSTYASYVTPAMAVFGDTLYVFFATGSEYKSEIGYYTYNSTNGLSQGPTSVPIPTPSSSSGPYYNAFLPLGSAIGITTDETNIYLSYATGTGSSSSQSLTLATFNVGKSDWSFSTIAQAPLRGAGLLSVGDSLYNFYLPSSGDINVLTSSDQGISWSAPSLVQAASGQYWLTYPNPVYFQENIFLGYGVQTEKNYNVDISYAISNPIYQSNQTQQFGQQLENIGDFNGDGIADFAVLAPGYFSNTSLFINIALQNNQGAVLVYYGNTSGFSSNSIPDLVIGTPPPNPSTNAATNQALLFSQVAPAGDVNGDGYDDLILASPVTALDAANTTDGVMFVVFGGGNDLWGNQYDPSKPFNLGVVTANTTQLFLDFTKALSTTSIPPTSAFTINNGLTEVTVNSLSVGSTTVTLNLNSNVDLSGFVSVLYTPPATGGLLYASGNNPQVAAFTASNDPDINTTSAISLSYDSSQIGQTQYGFQITGLPNAQSGISLAGSGDVNGDGFSDFLIGAPGNDDNLAYTLFGSDFNQTVNQTGTIGDDVMVGSPTGESFVAGQGLDLIVTGGGVDVAYAGPGDDQVIVNDVYFRRLDGGTGTDTLFFYGYNGQDWDLTTLSPGTRLRDFEILVTENYGANMLTLNSVSVTQLSPTNTLTLFIDKADTIVLSSDFQPAKDTSPPVVYQYNRNFTEYQSSSTAARVLVNQPNSTNQVTFGAPATNIPAPILPTASPPTEATATLAFNNVGPGVRMASTSSETSVVATTNNTASDLPTQIYVSNPTVSEHVGRADFTITRTGDLNQFVWLEYYTKDGDGKAGDRYIPVAGQLVFAPGENVKTVSVPIPNNTKYVGNRQFSLAVILEGESTDPSVVPVSWQAAIATPKEQIRNWDLHTMDGANNSLSFNVTSTHSQDRIATLDLNIQGTVIPQIWNPATKVFQNIPFDVTNGIAQFQDISGDSITDLYRLKFQDGGPFDGDGIVNGLVALNFDLNTLEPTVIPVDGGRIQGTNGNDYMSAQSSSGTTRLEGLDGNDVLIGSSQRDVLLGGNGNDVLYGAAGVDQLYGDAGDDLLDGGPGMNFLYGGPGADTFVLRAGNGPQRVMDFNSVAGDKFLLENLNFSQLGFQSNQIKYGTDTLAIVTDQAGRPITNLANNPAWFSTVQTI